LSVRVEKMLAACKSGGVVPSCLQPKKGFTEMRLIFPIGFSVVAAVLIAQIVPAKAGVTTLGRSFEFEPAEVVVDAGSGIANTAEQGEAEANKTFARSFSFEPVVVSGRVHKHLLATRSH
jgi:hypothetical protein